MMKSGAGDDPFAEETDQTDEDSEPSSQEETQEPLGESTDTTQSTETTTDDQEMSELPYIFARSEVKQDRDNVIQFFVRDEVDQGEDALLSAVADELNIREKELYKLDVREAAYLFAQQHPGAIADILREWGYEHK